MEQQSTGKKIVLQHLSEITNVIAAPEPYYFSSTDTDFVLANL
jgi:hypothetical protein